MREEAHNMGSVHMSEICTELKNLRSLVRVCEIQATLREQRILFLRQQIKELEKLKIRIPSWCEDVNNCTQS